MKKLRWGVGTKILICFLSVSIMSLLAASIAWFSQLQTQTSVQDFTHNVLPFVLEAYSFSEDVNKLTTMSPTFVHINRRAELEKTRQVVHNRKRNLIERTTMLAGKLETTRHDDALSSRLAHIFQNIWDLSNSS